MAFCHKNVYNSGMTQASAPAANTNLARSVARLAAVQALYQQAITELATPSLVKEFLDYRLRYGFDSDDTALPEADAEHFKTIVQTADVRFADIAQLLNGALAPNYTLERLEAPLSAILRAAVAEMLALPKIAMGVIINDYVDITHSFFAAREPALVHGVLDTLGKNLRG